MDWKILIDGKCPNCRIYLSKKGSIMQCDKCLFKIREAKFNDLIKGKDSDSYKKKIKEIKKYQLRALKTKINKENTANILRQEKIYNLNRMVGRGEISKDTYDIKILEINTKIIKTRKKIVKSAEILI